MLENLRIELVDEGGVAGDRLEWMVRRWACAGIGGLGDSVGCALVWEIAASEGPSWRLKAQVLTEKPCVGYCEWGSGFLSGLLNGRVGRFGDWDIVDVYPNHDVMSGQVVRLLRCFGSYPSYQIVCGTWGL